MTTRNSAASERARLLNKAQAQGVDFQLLLTRYGLERLLYRLSVSRKLCIDGHIVPIGWRPEDTT